MIKVHSTEKLEYWAEVFQRHDLKRYMRFDAFMQNPDKHFNDLVINRMDKMSLDAPMLAGVRSALERMDKVINELSTHTKNGLCH